MLSFEEVIEKLQEERVVRAEEVPASVRERKIWVAEWHFPGCLSESQAICLSKKEAIDAACSYAEDEFGDPPRGMKTALRKWERFDGEAYGAMCVTTIFQTTIGERLSCVESTAKRLRRSPQEVIRLLLTRELIWSESGVAPTAPFFEEGYRLPFPGCLSESQAQPPVWSH